MIGRDQGTRRQIQPQLVALGVQHLHRIAVPTVLLQPLQEVLRRLTMVPQQLFGYPDHGDQRALYTIPAAPLHAMILT